LITAALDAIRQISALVKLKLTNCAPISGLPEVGFLVGARGRAERAAGRHHIDCITSPRGWRAQ
jgi:hypothetical protein